MPQEVPDPIPFPDDTTHHVYDGEAANRFWRVLTLIEPVFEAYRAVFQGKVSRVQFFWGSADLAVTRFSGEPCTPPAGAGMLERGAYDYEQMSVGWWPGNASFPEPAFYAYAYPKPEGIESAELGITGRVLEPRPRRVHPPLRRRPRRAVARGHGPPIPRRRLRRLRLPLRLGPQPHQVRTGVVRTRYRGQPTTPFTLRSTMVSQSRPSFSVRISSPCSLNSGPRLVGAGAPLNCTGVLTSVNGVPPLEWISCR